MCASGAFSAAARRSGSSRSLCPGQLTQALPTEEGGGARGPDTDAARPGRRVPLGVGPLPTSQGDACTEQEPSFRPAPASPSPPSVRRTAASVTAACGTLKAQCSPDDGREPRTRCLDTLGWTGARRRGRVPAAPEDAEAGGRPLGPAWPPPRGQRGSDPACGGGPRTDRPWDPAVRLVVPRVPRSLLGRGVAARGTSTRAGSRRSWFSVLLSKLHANEV